MTPLIQKIVAGAVSGFVAAFVVDISAWSKFPGKPFAWGLAFQRWISGALSGVLGALGMGSVFGDPAAAEAPQIDA